jgi:hypothetical protein
MLFLWEHSRMSTAQEKNMKRRCLTKVPLQWIQRMSLSSINTFGLILCLGVIQSQWRRKSDPDRGAI